MQQYNMVINGQSVQSGSWLDVINPATAKVFAQCPKADASHVDQAVSAARAAFPQWSAQTMDERKKAIHAIGAAIEANMPALMELITKETGKPQGGLNGVGAGMEIGGAAAWTHYTAELELPVDVLQDNEQARIELHRKPLGVVGSITPWNWPVLIATWHVMPAMLAGNTVVMKPSPMTPITTIRLVELANEILPAGVLNIVTGENDVGAAISKHSDIDKIVFTGSAATGKSIMREASAGLTRLTLELGGNDAGIVLPDVDVQKVAPGIFGACFHNNGQTCACLKRLYVHESMYDEMGAALAAIAKSVRVGDGLEQDTELGPIQNKTQFDKIVALAKDAKAAGGHFLAGGNVMERDGYFFEPSIVSNLKDGSRLVDEEPFGPIVPMIKYSDVDEVIARANDNETGLGGSVWSSDVAKATKIASQLECGTVWINDHGSIQPNMPFGGVKQSGFGVEFTRHGLEEFISMQSVKITK